MSSSGSTLHSVTTRLSLCTIVGGCSGAFVGMIFGLAQLEHPDAAVSPGDLVVIALAGALTIWLILLLVLGLWLRYGVRAIAAQTLVNSFITAFLTVLICDALETPMLSSLIGLVVGIAVGSLLCMLCGRWPYLHRLLGMENDDGGGHVRHGRQ